MIGGGKLSVRKKSLRSAVDPSDVTLQIVEKSWKDGLYPLK